MSWRHAPVLDACLCPVSRFFCVLRHQVGVPSSANASEGETPADQLNPMYGLPATLHTTSPSKQDADAQRAASKNFPVPAGVCRTPPSSPSKRRLSSATCSPAAGLSPTLSPLSALVRSQHATGSPLGFPSPAVPGAKAQATTTANRQQLTSSATSSESEDCLNRCRRFLRKAKAKFAGQPDR